MTETITWITWIIGIMLALQVLGGIIGWLGAIVTERRMANDNNSDKE